MFTENQKEEIFKVSKNISEFTGKLVSKLVVYTTMVITLFAIEYAVNYLTGDTIFGRMAFWTLVFIMGLNIISANIYLYFLKKTTEASLHKIIEEYEENLKNEQLNFDEPDFEEPKENKPKNKGSRKKSNNKM